MVVTAHHRIISDECRVNHGDDGAMEQALSTAQDSINKLYRYWPVGKEAKIHIRIDVEYADVVLT